MVTVVADGPCGTANIDLANECAMLAAETVIPDVGDEPEEVSI